MLSSLYFDYKDITYLVLNCTIHHAILSEHQYKKIWLSRKNDILLDYALTVNPIPGLSKLIRKTRDRQLAQWHRDHPNLIESGIHDHAFDTVRERITEWVSAKDSYQEAVAICDQKIDKKAGESVFLSFQRTIINLLTEQWYNQLDREDQQTQKGYDFTFLKEEMTEYMDILFKLYLQGATESEILIAAVIEIEKLSGEEKENAILMFLTALNQGRLAYDDLQNTFFENKTYSCSQGLLERIKDYFWSTLMPLKEYKPTLEESYQKTITDYFNTANSAFLYTLFFHSIQTLGYGKEHLVVAYDLKEDVETTIQKIQATPISLEEESAQSVPQVNIFLTKLRNLIDNREILGKHHFAACSDLSAIDRPALQGASRLCCTTDQKDSVPSAVLAFLRHPTVYPIWHKFIISEKIAAIQRHHCKSNPGLLLSYMGKPYFKKEREVFDFCPLTEPLSLKKALEQIQLKMSEIGAMPIEWINYILDMNRDSDMRGMICLYEDGLDPDMTIETLLEILSEKKKEIILYQHELFSKQIYPFSFMRYFIIDSIKPLLIERIISLSLEEWIYSELEISSSLPCQANWIIEWISSGWFDQAVLHGIACKALEIKSYLLLKATLDYGADANWVNADGYPLAILAIKKIATEDCSLDMLELLLSRGAILECHDPSHRTLVHYAVMNNSLSTLKFLYQHHMNPNAIDHHDRTALFYFHSDSQFDVIQYLVQIFQIDIFIRDKKGYTPVHMAINKGCLVILKYLLTIHLSVDVLDHDRNSVLSYFCENKYKEAFKIALQFNPDLEKGDADGFSLLDLAIQNNQREIAQLLLEKGANLDSKDCHKRTPIFNVPLYIHNYPTGNDVTEMMDLLKKHGAALHAQDWYARGLLYYAFQAQSIPLLEYLFSQGLRFDEYENPLTWITKETQIHIVCFLLENHSRIAKSKWEMRLDLMLMRNCPEIAKIFIQYGAYLPEILESTSLFFNLIRDKKSYSLHFLLQQKTAQELSSMMEKGYSLLTYGIIHKNTKAVRLLLAKGIPIAIGAKEGGCPLHYAVMNNQIKSIKYMFNRMIDLSDNNILCAAAIKGNTQVVTLLINHGAPVNCVEPDLYHTPLSRAIEFERTGAFLLLLHNKADINYRPEQSSSKYANRETPLTLAIKKRDVFMISALLGYPNMIPSIANLDNETPLYLLIKYDLLDLADTVLSSDQNASSLFQPCCRGVNALDLIFEKKCYMLFRQVIRQKDVFASELKKVSLLEYAIRSADPVFIEILFESAQASCENAVRELANAEMSYLHMPALFYAIHLNEPKVVPILITKGANIECLFMNYTPLGFAFYSKKILMIEVLLRHQLLTPSEKTKWFFEAIYTHSVKILKMVLTHYERSCYGIFDINVMNSHGETGLVYALRHQSRNIFDYLLYQGANPNKLDCYYRSDLAGHHDDLSYKTSVLHIAVCKSDVKSAEALLESGANVNRSDNKGLRPLSIAIANNNTTLIKILLKFGADIDAALTTEDLVWNVSLEKMRCSPLIKSMRHYYATLSCARKMVCEAFRYSAQWRDAESPKDFFDVQESYLESLLNRAPCFYESAHKLVGLLFFAVEKNMKKILSLLIAKAPILLEARNTLRETAFEVAISQNKTEAIAILEQGRSADTTFLEYKECLLMRREDTRNLTSIKQERSTDIRLHLRASTIG